MTRDQKLQALRDWHERMKECDAALADVLDGRTHDGFPEVSE